MTEIEFKIFTPVKTRRIAPNMVVLSILLPSYIFAFFSERLIESQILKDLGLFGLVIVGVLAIYYTITKHSKIQPLNGTLDKSLIFSSNWISINGDKHALNSLEKIDFIIQDYFDKWEYTKDFNPVRTNGTDNKLILTLVSGEKIEVNFQLMYKDQLIKIKEHLINYHSYGAIHFLKLIDLLGIENYEEIQEFKKTLPPTLRKMQGS